MSGLYFATTWMWSLLSLNCLTSSSTTNPPCVSALQCQYSITVFSPEELFPPVPDPVPVSVLVSVLVSVPASAPLPVWFTAAVPVCALAAPALSRALLPDAAPQPDKTAIEADTETAMANAIKDFTLLLITPFPPNHSVVCFILKIECKFRKIKSVKSLQGIGKVQK